MQAISEEIEDTLIYAMTAKTSKNIHVHINNFLDHPQ